MRAFNEVKQYDLIATGSSLGLWHGFQRFEPIRLQTFTIESSAAWRCKIATYTNPSKWFEVVHIFILALWSSYWWVQEQLVPFLVVLYGSGTRRWILRLFNSLAPLALVHFSSSLVCILRVARTVRIRKTKPPQHPHEQIWLVSARCESNTVKKGCYTLLFLPAYNSVIVLF